VQRATAKYIIQSLTVYKILLLHFAVIHPLNCLYIYDKSCRIL